MYTLHGQITQKYFVIRFEICSSDHCMRSHVPAFLVSEGEKKMFLKFKNVIESEALKG